jgi:hypothetical protein
MRVEVKHPELKAIADQVADVNEDRYARKKLKRDPEGQARYMEAYRRISQSDPVQQGWDKYNAEFRAKAHIYRVLSTAMETELGHKDGRDGVRRARTKQGQESGERMAKVVRDQGKRLSLQSFFDVFWGYFSWSPHVDDEKYYDDDDNLVKYVLRLNCPIGDYLSENTDIEVASNYCDLDEFIAQSFNPNIRYSRKHWVGGGDRYSELIWELDADGIID